MAAEQSIDNGSQGSTLANLDTEHAYWENASGRLSPSDLATICRSLRAARVMARLIGTDASEDDFEPRGFTLGSGEVDALAGGIAELCAGIESRLHGLVDIEVAPALRSVA